MTVRLIQREIPTRTAHSNAFTDIITAEMRSLLKRSPGAAFLICDDDGKPHIMPMKLLNALRQSCPRPYRILTRQATARKSERYVWISNDPGHWERLDQKRRQSSTSTP